MHMNKFFIISIISCAFLSLYGNFKDVSNYPFVYSGVIEQIGDFHKQYPQEKVVGYYSDNKNTAHIMYRIQNTIMPVFVADSADYDLIFCYSESDACQKVIKNGKAELVKAYFSNLLLIRKKGVIE